MSAPGAAGGRWWPRARFIAVLWLLMLPSLAGLTLFTYYPNLETVQYSFFLWDGGSVEEWCGLANFRRIFQEDAVYWRSFALIGVLLLANLAKMWPSIFAAIVLHRLRSERWQYAYRVLFVIPMVIPGLVALLIWKSFFDPTVGLLNATLNATGLMGLLDRLDAAMPALAAFIEGAVLRWDGARPVASLLTLPGKAILPVFGSLWGLCLFGIALLLLRGGVATVGRNALLWIVFGVLAWLAWGPAPLALALRGGVLLAGAAVLAEWLRRHAPLEGRDRITRWAWAAIGLGGALILLSQVWTEPSRAFAYAQPSWLGHSQLVVPAVILWGFPWIGTVGVLIYLAGLQNISKEVYEAADLDGIGFWGKIFRIEVPLIMSQVRINLIFMTIGTLNQWAFFLILLGPDGGPNNRGMTPGLHLYNHAFVQGNMGYACALGMVMFTVILFLTVVYQRHVKVER